MKLGEIFCSAVIEEVTCVLLNIVKQRHIKSNVFHGEATDNQFEEE